MKQLMIYSILLAVVASGCVRKFDETFDRPTNATIVEVLVGNALGKLSQENAIDTDAHIDTLFVKDRSADFRNVYLQVNLGTGCSIKPLDNSPLLGQYGDFSVPHRYRVTAPSGEYTDWTIVLAYYLPPVGCLVDRWKGELFCSDEFYPDYSPDLCTGSKIDTDCQRLEITFDFWADAKAEVNLHLELGDINMETYMGTVSLLNDVIFSSYESEMTFHAGVAGTYNALSKVLHLELLFSGYDIGGETYNFTISQY